MMNYKLLHIPSGTYWNNFYYHDKKIIKLVIISLLRNYNYSIKIKENTINIFYFCPELITKIKEIKILSFNEFELVETKISNEDRTLEDLGFYFKQAEKKLLGFKLKNEKI